MNIPFMDLKAQYQSIKKEIDSAMQNVLDQTQFIGGEIKDTFEKNFASAVGAKYCVGVANGTDAIYISLMAMGVGAGDEVIVPANSFIATSESVTVAGAKPIFIDVDPKTFHIDLKLLRDMLSKKSKKAGGKIRAIIPVHLYGRICDMRQIMALAKEFDVLVLEDTAQAHLAILNGRRAGTWGQSGTFSFYPGKNLGAYGDAGCAVTDSETLALKIKKIANHGRTKKYDHDMEGFNSRLDTLQAAVLDVKLKHLQSWSDSRYEKALNYSRLLSDYHDIVTPPEIPAAGEHVFHLYVVRIKNREKVQELLAKKGIQTIIHYPIALHNLEAYRFMNHKPTDFPVANLLQSEILSLPLFPEITSEQQEYVVKNLVETIKSL